jgi:Zn-finger in ubiquitin-hydrolases and other protein
MMVGRRRRPEGGREDERRDRPLRLFRNRLRAGRPIYSPNPCQHLLANPPRAVDVPDGCEDHKPEDGPVVHLRVCLACEHVGCCDSSAPRHATAHATSTGHPVIQSAEAGETWRWCYPDELLG